VRRFLSLSHTQAGSGVAQEVISDKEGSGDFVLLLWNFLKRATTIGDYCEGLRMVLSEVHSGTIVPLIEPQNKTSLGLLLAIVYSRDHQSSSSRLPNSVLLLLLMNPYCTGMLLKNCVLAIQKKGYEQENKPTVSADDDNEWIKMMHFALQNSKAKPVLLKCIGWLIESGIWCLTQGICNWLQRKKLIAAVSTPIRKIADEAFKNNNDSNNKHDLHNNKFQRLGAALNAIKALSCAMTLGISNAALQKIVADALKSESVKTTGGSGYTIPLGVGLGDKTRSNLTEPPLLWDLNLQTTGKRGEAFKQTMRISRISKHDFKFEGTPATEPLIKTPNNNGSSGAQANISRVSAYMPPPPPNSPRPA
jgi:hypothetical protein